MVRMTVLCLGLITFTPWVPQGCPLVGPSEPNEPVVPADIATTAAATVNEEPYATAVPYNQLVKLTATATANNAEDTLSYTWTQTAGVGVAIQDATSAVATFRAPSVPADQTLRFVVTARASNGDLGHATVTVPVAADAEYGQHFEFNGDTTIPPDSGGPRAKAGNDQNVLPADTVTLDASKSTGTTLTYAWRQVGGARVELTDADKAAATFPAPAFDPASTNELTFQVRVTDSRQRSASDSLVITVLDPEKTGPRVKLATSFGDIVVELDPDRAPLSTENFLQYVDDGFYTNTIFHRVIPGFVVQGGGFGPGLDRKEPRDPIDSEADNGLKNLRGTIALARTTEPNTATSQFYFNLIDNTDLDHTDAQEGYTVFGKVISGMEVVDQIATVPTESRSGFQDVPVNDILVTAATRLDPAE